MVHGYKKTAQVCSGWHTKAVVRQLREKHPKWRRQTQWLGSGSLSSLPTGHWGVHWVEGYSFFSGSGKLEVVGAGPGEITLPWGA